MSEYALSGKKVAVFSAGTWGSALACLLHDKDLAVGLWEYDPRVADHLRETRSPAKLPHLTVPADIPISTDLAEIAGDTNHWVVVAPSRGVRALGEGLRPMFNAHPPETITLCSKGIDPDTGQTLTQVMAEVLGQDAGRRMVALSGPSHAEEVSRQMPTTVVAAAEVPTLAEAVQALFNTRRFRVYTSSDTLGVELGGALKNVIAIAVGACDGMGFGDNTRAALITRGLAEMTRLSLKMGAQAETLAGLAGMGDLIVTATSRHSRNRNFGELLGQGVTAEEARRRIGMEIEGQYATLSAQRLAQRHAVDMPISQKVYELLYENLTPAQAVHDLLAREPRPEIYF